MTVPTGVPGWGALEPSEAPATPVPAGAGASAVGGAGWGGERRGGSLGNPTLRDLHAPIVNLLEALVG
eukprot:6992032-Alexandrium_andersonii.AAC.1